MKQTKPKYQQIIEAAVKVIAENGYHGSQISKIAKEAGVADGTIYLYFKNKEDILVSVFEEKMGEFIHEISEATKMFDTANEQLLKLIEMHFSQLEKNPHLATVTQLELRQSNYDLRRQINLVLKRYLDVIDGIIDCGKEEGIFRTDIQTNLIRQMVFGALDEVVTNWVLQGKKFQLIEQVEQVYQLITLGIKN